MSEVFDLDALVREREQQPFRFRFGGDDYELPATVDLRLAADISNLEKAGVAGALDVLRRLLGPAQWERLDRSDAVLDVQAFMSLLDRYGEHLGASLGESRASSSSSKSTAKRSRPTSNARTISASA